MPPTQSHRLLFVQHALRLYQLTPGTSGHIRRSDRQLASSLYDRGVSLDIVSTALLFTVARRVFRSGHPLPPIASFHYFRPVIEELLDQPPDPGYIAHIAARLAPVVPDFTAAMAHQLS